MVEQKEERNLNPHAEAYLCSRIYSEGYSAQDGGVMEFWDSARDYMKEFTRQELEKLLSLPRERKYEEEDV